MLELNDRERFRTKVLMQEFSPDQFKALSIREPLLFRESFAERVFSRVRDNLKFAKPVLIGGALGTSWGLGISGVATVGLWVVTRNPDVVLYSQVPIMVFSLSCGAIGAAVGTWIGEEFKNAQLID